MYSEGDDDVYALEGDPGVGVGSSSSEDTAGRTGYKALTVHNGGEREENAKADHRVIEEPSAYLRYISGKSDSVPAENSQK